MTDDTERSSVQPEDWPLEETTTDGNSSGLRQDIGVSGERARSEDDSAPLGAGLDGGRGETGTNTPGERGTDNEPR
ncbi:MAG: hypothetical protein QOH36_372 [Actinomycetota bacterium]|nr:hypothetical protein [Actinomycetota bacterium]